METLQEDIEPWRWTTRIKIIFDYSYNATSPPRSACYLARNVLCLLRDLVTNILRSYIVCRFTRSMVNWVTARSKD